MMLAGEFLVLTFESITVKAKAVARLLNPDNFRSLITLILTLWNLPMFTNPEKTSLRYENDRRI